MVKVTAVDAEVLRVASVPNVLKIDAEGHDLLVLQGAQNSLEDIDCVVIEAAVCCSTMPNTVPVVCERMLKLGYMLVGVVDLNSYHTPTGQQIHGILWLMDLLFARTGTKLHRVFSLPN